MHTAIWSFTPKKAGYMDTQLSPANALNTYMSDMSGVGCAVVNTLPPPWEYASAEKSGYAATQLYTLVG